MNNPPGYVMRREGTKRYAFFERTEFSISDMAWSNSLPDFAAVFRCRCSHIEARKRFATFLILRRLTT